MPLDEVHYFVEGIRELLRERGFRQARESLHGNSFDPAESWSNGRCSVTFKRTHLGGLEMTITEGTYTTAHTNCNADAAWLEDHL